MHATVSWQDAVRFIGESDTGHAITMDGPPTLGGTNAGPRPMEMVLLGLGGCSALDVVNILRRGRRTVEDCRAEIEAERAETDPRVFTRIHLHFVVRSPDATRDFVERAVRLSAEKYCSVALMLASTAEISHSAELAPAQ